VTAPLRGADLRVVVAWYDEKTDFLLEKYGPGPRIHYHTGLAPPDVSAAPSAAGVREQIRASQEAMMWRAVEAWRLPHGLRIADLGCGLGGASLFVAAERDARVVALTPVPRHQSIVERLAAEAKLADRVEVIVGDAHDLSAVGQIDGVMAMGASNYFNRDTWFAELARVLPPGGLVCVEDTFVVRPSLRAPFNEYWSSNIGAFPEYETAAARHGFELLGETDVSHEAAGFWALSVAYSERLLAEERPVDVTKRRRSIAWQSAVYDAYLDGGFLNLLVCWRRR
jgi:tocopherol O-methyltransferase